LQLLAHIWICNEIGEVRTNMNCRDFNTIYNLTCYKIIVNHPDSHNLIIYPNMHLNAQISMIIWSQNTTMMCVEYFFLKCWVVIERKGSNLARFLMSPFIDFHVTDLRLIIRLIPVFISGVIFLAKIWIIWTLNLVWWLILKYLDTRN